MQEQGLQTAVFKTARAWWASEDEGGEGGGCGEEGGGGGVTSQGESQSSAAVIGAEASQPHISQLRHMAAHVL